MARQMKRPSGEGVNHTDTSKSTSTTVGIPTRSNLGGDGYQEMPGEVISADTPSEANRKRSRERAGAGTNAYDLYSS